MESARITENTEYEDGTETPEKVIVRASVESAASGFSAILTAIGDRSNGYTLGGPGQTAHTYGYDDLNRLVSGSASGGEFPSFSASWGYNAIGNMTSKEVAAQGFAPSGANSTRPHAVITTSNPQQASFGYEPNGNKVATSTAVGSQPDYFDDALESLPRRKPVSTSSPVGHLSRSRQMRCPAAGRRSDRSRHHPPRPSSVSGQIAFALALLLWSRVSGQTTPTEPCVGLSRGVHDSADGVKIALMRAPAIFGRAEGLSAQEEIHHMNTQTHTRLLALAASAAVALAACGGAAAPAATSAPAATAAPAKPTEAPKPTKLTVLCTVTEDWCVAQTKAFEAKTGIKTSFTRLSSGEAATKLKATANNPEYSVWWGGPADGFVQAKGDGTLAAYKSPNAAKIQDKAKDPDGFWTGVYVGALGFCSNKVELDKLGLKPPTSWNDLLDPKLKGKFSVAHPATSGTSYTMVWTQVTLLGSEEKAFEYLKALHPQVAQYTKSGAAPAQAVGRAEAVVGVVFSHDCVAAVDSGFKDVVVSFAKEGTGYEIGAMGLVKGGPEEAAAKMWIDWALTPEAQEIGPSAKAYQLPTNPDAKVSDRSIKLSEVNLINYDFVKAGTAKKGITTKFEETIASQPK